MAAAAPVVGWRRRRLWRRDERDGCWEKAMAFYFCRAAPSSRGRAASNTPSKDALDGRRTAWCFGGGCGALALQGEPEAMLHVNSGAAQARALVCAAPGACGVFLPGDAA